MITKAGVREPQAGLYGVFSSVMIHGRVGGAYLITEVAGKRLYVDKEPSLGGSPGRQHKPMSSLVFLTDTLEEAEQLRSLSSECVSLGSKLEKELGEAVQAHWKEGLAKLGLAE